MRSQIWRHSIARGVNFSGRRAALKLEGCNFQFEPARYTIKIGGTLNGGRVKEEKSLDILTVKQPRNTLWGGLGPSEGVAL